MFRNFKADIHRHIDGASLNEKIYVIFEQGLWAIAAYRFSRWARTIKIPIVDLILKVIASLLFKLMEIITGISLPASADIGPGFYVGHFGYCIVHSNVKMGAHCSIGPGVVIGTQGLGEKGVPTLGDNVYVGSGAKILGDIKIGNNVRIGANAVVIHDVVSGSTVVGIPAKVVTTDKQGNT